MIRRSSRTGCGISSAIPAGRAGGVIPWLDAARRLPPEDAAGLDRPGELPVGTDGERVRIVAPRLSRVANFDDVDPLRLEPAVDFAFVPAGSPPAA